MLKGTLITEQETISPPEREEVVYLQEDDLKAIIRCLLDFCYDEKVDTYQCPPEILILGEELGVV